MKHFKETVIDCPVGPHLEIEELVKQRKERMEERNIDNTLSDSHTKPFIQESRGPLTEESLKLRILEKVCKYPIENGTTPDISSPIIPFHFSVPLMFIIASPYLLSLTRCIVKFSDRSLPISIRRSIQNPVQ